ncbi:MAG: hypothetical protein ACK5KO_02450 [Arachnia sp.]
MGREFVILADREPSVNEWGLCSGSLIGEGMVRGYEGGVTHLLDSHGNGLVAFWPARHIEERREAVALVGDAAQRALLWIDVAPRPDHEELGVAIAAEMARRADGILVEVP